MVAAKAIQRRHSPDVGIQWLRVKPWTWFILHRAMRLTSYRCIAMAIEITSDSSAFFVVVDSLLPTTMAK
jgi:hypothetical protein